VDFGESPTADRNFVNAIMHPVRSRFGGIG
jgi:hypothetical protein